jgi:methylated-DNA-[protein]-cysteine S-methyltransferase
MIIFVGTLSQKRVKRGSRLFFDVFECPVGWVALLASERGLVRLRVGSSRDGALDSALEGVSWAVQGTQSLDEIRRQVEDYFLGETEALEGIPLDPELAPPFYRRAWLACRRIPPGETRSYSWLATAAGNPHALRAAGQAMAKNPLALIVPCHRVVGSDGGLHGYAGGLETKARLLEMEKEYAARQ